MNTSYSTKQVLYWSIFLLSMVAQGQPSPIEFELHYHKEGNGFEDLGSNMFIDQTSNGYIWISSLNDGFYRFNGLEYQKYPKEGSIGLSVQSHLFEDLKGDAWFTSEDYLHQYQHEFDRIKTIEVKDRNGTLLEYPKPFFINKRKGELWMKAGNRLGMVNINAPFQPFQLISSDTTIGARYTVLQSLEEEVEVIFSNPWHNKEGIEVWTKDQAAAWSKKVEPVFVGNEKSQSPRVARILIENDSVLWLLSVDQGVILFDWKQSKVIKQVRHPSYEDLQCRDGIYYNDSTVLVATQKHGILQIDRKSQAFIMIPDHYTQNKYDLNRCFGLFQDQQGRLWTGQYEKGVYRSKEPLKAFYNPLPDWGKPSHIRSILEDGKQQIWVATVENGLFVFSREMEFQNHIPYHEIAPSIKKLQHFSIDAKGVKWMMDANNLYRCRKKKWEKIDELNAMFLSIFHHSSGRKYVSTVNGLKELLLEGDSARLQMVTSFSGNDIKKVVNLYEMSNGYTVVAEVGRKLSFYTFQDRQFRLIESVEIPADFYAFSESLNGDTLFVGTNKGLRAIDLKNQFKSTLINVEDTKLGATPIYGMRSDDSGGLWITSRKGFYYSKGNTFYKYLPEDGIVSNRFKNHQPIKASDGRIWFGSEEGPIVFHPDEIKPYASPPKVHFEELWIDDQLSTDSVYINELTHLELEYTVSSFRLKVQVVDYHLPEFNTFQYRVKESGENWQEKKNGEYLRIEGIPLDYFTLEVRGLNANGIASEIRSLVIDVQIPFWQKIWFWLLVVVGAMMLVYLGLRTRLERKLAVQQRLFDERNRIASDLHDDIGSTLSNIRILATLARQKALPHSPTLSVINRIEEEAHHSAESLDDIIWSINSQNDSMDRVFARMRRYASEVFEAQGINGIIRFPKAAAILSIHMSKRRQVYLFFKEAINNLSKYAQCHNAWVEVDYQNRELCLIIKDDGCGFDLQAYDGRGNGLRTMKERVESLNGTLVINTAPGQGTFIKACLPITEKED